MSAKLFNPDYLLSLCQKYNLQPSKHYGQNFLIDERPIEEMLEAAELSPTDTVVEIGPGFGVLTFALAEKVKKVIAFEIEKKLAGYWEEQIKKYPNVEIVWGNALKTQKSKMKNQNYKVVANLPYQITSPVLRFFLESDNPPEMMVLMVQKEVAERICAVKGKMSMLSVAVQYYAEAEIITNALRSFFWPEPRVDSAVIKIVPSSTLPAGRQEFPVHSSRENDKFFKIVKTGFANRRKMLIKNLESLSGKKNRPDLEAIFAKLGLNLKIRAQELSVDEWRQLTGRLSLEIKN